MTLEARYADIRKMAEKPKESAGQLPRLASERRMHSRYGFMADAEVVEGSSGERIEGRIVDISQRGCYVQSDRSFPLGEEITVRISKDPNCLVARARVVYASAHGMGLAFSDITQEVFEVLEAWLGPLREKDVLARNRRSTQRVQMRIPVRLSGEDPFGSRFQEETHTDAVNATGALIHLSTSVRKGQRLKLVNTATADEAECLVAHLGRRQGERLEVGIAFILPNPKFWHVVFPPHDWTPPTAEGF
jgi:PilZ domain